MKTYVMEVVEWRLRATTLYVRASSPEAALRLCNERGHEVLPIWDNPDREEYLVSYGWTGRETDEDPELDAEE